MTRLLIMRAARFWACLGGALLCTQLATAQTESSPLPLDDFTERAVVQERRVLTHPPVREADILWEKRIWRVVDVREKRNQPFAAPQSPLFKILSEAAMQGDLTVYGTADDRFGTPLSPDEVRDKLFSVDTIYRPNLDTGEEEIVVVTNERDWEQVKRFRLKEAWYFDARTGTLQVRLLGIAPMMDVLDENGDFKYEMPLFWVHYPSARPLLAQHQAVLHGGNLAATITWEDLLEQRQFASTITKENNVSDLRLQDKYSSGTELLAQADRIENAIFNFEHDLWSW